MTKKTMRTKFILLFLAVGLVWTGTALAINVPDGDFDTVATVGNGGLWDYVNDHDTPWTATIYGGSPWIGNNYSYGGLYPGMGHSGAQWVDMNYSYIHQALGATYADGVTYELSLWATTPSAGDRVFGYFTDATGSGDGWTGATVLSTETQTVPDSADHTWNQMVYTYTATAADDGKPIGIALFGDYDTYVDTVTLIGSMVLPVTPSNEAINVAVNETLGWTSPTVFGATGYDVYFGTEPNKLDNPLVVDYVDTTTFDPFGAGDMAYGTIYYWWVDVYEPNTVEPFTAIRHVSDGLSFTTIAATPIITADPVGTVVDAGGPATLTVEHINGTSYEWYKVGVAEAIDSGPTATGETITLSLVSVSQSDEGLYYCKVINDAAPEGVDSGMAKLMTKRLIGHWPMDGTSKDRNVADSSSGGVDGTIVTRDVTDLGGNVPGPGAGWSWVTGINGGALELVQDATNANIHDYVILATSGDATDLEFGATMDFSVSLWIKGTDFSVGPVDAGYDAPIISNKNWWSGGNPGWVMDINTGTNQLEWNIGSGGRADYDPSGGPLLNDDQWHHLVATHDRDGYATFYVDGVLQAQVNMDHIGNIDSGYPTIIGTDGTEGVGWAAWFRGMIDDVRMWNYVINPYAVAALYTEFVPTADTWCVENESIPDYNNSCTVDLGDMAAIAAKWAECNVVPDCLDQHDYSVD